jgi:hypothetical protein
VVNPLIESYFPNSSNPFDQLSSIQIQIQPARPWIQLDLAPYWY